MVVMLVCSFGTRDLTLQSDGLLYVQVAGVSPLFASPITMVYSERTRSIFAKVAIVKTWAVAARTCSVGAMTSIIGIRVVDGLVSTAMTTLLCAGQVAQGSSGVVITGFQLFLTMAAICSLTIGTRSTIMVVMVGVIEKPLGTCIVDGV
jgi:hypothetical protein